MNTYFHRIRIVIERNKPSKDNRMYIGQLLDTVKNNPNFVEQKDEAWAREAVAEAEKFIQG